MLTGGSIFRLLSDTAGKQVEELRGSSQHVAGRLMLSLAADRETRARRQALPPDPTQQPER